MNLLADDDESFARGVGHHFQCSAGMRISSLFTVKWFTTNNKFQLVEV